MCVKGSSLIGSAGSFVYYCVFILKTGCVLRLNYYYCERFEYAVVSTAAAPMLLLQRKLNEALNVMLGVLIVQYT